MPAMITLHPSGRPSRIRFIDEGQDLVIGRDPDADCVLDDPRVSKRHACFTWDGGGWRLDDLGSKNGTRVNGLATVAGPLRHGDWLSLGGLIARFEIVSAEAVAAHQRERARRIHTSADVVRELRASPDSSTLLRRFLESAIELTAADRGFILVVGADGMLRAEAAAGFAADGLDDAGFNGSFGAVEQALRSGQVLVVSDLQRDAMLSQRPSVVEQRLATLACVPFHHDGRLVGLLYVDSRAVGPGLTELDLEILEALAEQAAIAMISVQLQGKVRELHRMVVGESQLVGTAVLKELQRRFGGPSQRVAPSRMPLV
jgi:GAF domain/FHA domain